MKYFNYKKIETYIILLYYYIILLYYLHQMISLTEKASNTMYFRIPLVMRFYGQNTSKITPIF